MQHTTSRARLRGIPSPARRGWGCPLSWSSRHERRHRRHRGPHRVSVPLSADRRCPTVTSSSRSTSYRLVRTGEPGTFWEQCDVTDRNAVEGALLSGFERIGKPPAALVHCAGGIYLTSPSETADLSVWERVLAVNATGSFQLASLVGRHMLAAGSGSIVLLSSIAWALGDNTEPSAAYAASKGGAVVSLGRQLATEWGTARGGANECCSSRCHRHRDDDHHQRRSRIPVSRRLDPTGAHRHRGRGRTRLPVSRFHRRILRQRRRDPPWTAASWSCDGKPSGTAARVGDRL